MGQQIFPKTQELSLVESSSFLEPQADVLKQSYTIFDAEQSWQKKVSINITTVIWENALREQFNLEGLEDFDCWFLSWHKPEIGASHLLQSTHIKEAQSSITSFRSNVFFTISAQLDNKPAPLAFGECGWNQSGHWARDQFSNIIQGLSQRDDVLGYHYASEQKASSIVLGIESKSMDAIGQCDGLMVWPMTQGKSFEVRYQLDENLDNASFRTLAGFDAAIAKAKSKDKAWVESKKAPPSYLDAKGKDYYYRTLLTLKQMQDPAGGIIAAPEFHYPFTHCGGYGYCWGRDAGFISYAMDVCGMHEESAEFYRYMAKCQSANGSFLHRHDMDGNLGSSWGHLQPDETGSVVFGLWQHVKLSDNKEIAEELREMVDNSCQWLAEAKHSRDPELPIEGHDLWEERIGVHYYAVAAMAAGLKAGLDLYDYMGWEKPALWQERFDSLSKLCHSDRFMKKDGKNTFFARTLLRKLDRETSLKMKQVGASVESYTNDHGREELALERDFVADISQLGAGYPYNIFDFENHGDAWDELIDVTYAQLWRPGVGGVGRYEADYYRDGNPWILATLWLALAADQRGKKDIAKKCWKWVYDHTSPEGLLAEQIDPKTGNPSWVMPLTWSHAMYGLAVHQLKEEVISND